MKVTNVEAEKLLKGNQIFEQLGFSMLLARLKKLYLQDGTDSALQKCADEINAFLDKFMTIMGADYDNISKSLQMGGESGFLSFDRTLRKIRDGKLLHIAGTESLLKKLPKGNWIGGSTEYFLTEGGGVISDEKLFVTEFAYEKFLIKSYNKTEIANVANDAFDNGFSILVIPADSEVHIEYAENAANYENTFMRNIIGWITGMNLNDDGQTPITVNGMEPAAYKDMAVALHLCIPDDKTVKINILNIFTQDEDSPVIRFTKEGFSAAGCLINGKETVLADYIEQNGINIMLPLVGDYSGNGVNISFKSIENGVVNFYAPVFDNIEYRMAKEIPDYVTAFHDQISAIDDENTVFSCNCILNFLYGELEGKRIEKYFGPVTFGEIAYQLLNQTLVYVTVSD